MTKIDNDIKRRLALAVCQGTRQQSFVNEALSGKPVAIKAYSFGNGPIHQLVGHSELGWNSFLNLRKRLVSVGFVIKVEHHRSVTMIFPGGY